MDLSITSSSAFSNGLSAFGSRVGQADPEQPSTTPADPESSNDQTAASESASQRPAREPQQSSRLTPEELQQLSELQQRDREVKAHELAHKAVGGRYVTGGSFSYQTGPDGHRYAIGGEVTIDSSSGSTAQETLRKADLIRRAALAPADPSPQDYRVASEANMMAAQARGEISAEQREKAIERQEAMREQRAEEANAEESQEISPQGRRAIASFEAVGGSTQLQSNPDPIDEII
jgi:23S rRNA maturation mini-RNase III